jgi:hypothetical protein
VQTFQYVSEEWKKKNPQTYSELKSAPKVQTEQKTEK